MDDDAHDSLPHTNDGPWRPGALLGPGASAMVAFTLAVLVLTGNNLMVIGTQSAFGQLFSSSSDPMAYFVTWGLGALVPAAASLFLARRALASGSPSGWELMLARAAVVLAAIALLYGALTVLGALLHSY